jgi:uncharacterized membrane protein YbaN (DUF454 family)
MLKSILLSVAAVGLLVLGLIGLVIPVIPGVLLLVGAAFCASAASPRVREQLHRNPTMRRVHRRWHASEGLGIIDRLKLALWLGADTVASSIPGTRHQR